MNTCTTSNFTKVLFKLYDLLAGAPLVARPAAGGVVVGAAPLALHRDPPLAAALRDGHGPIQTCKRCWTMLSVLRERHKAPHQCRSLQTTISGKDKMIVGAFSNIVSTLSS